MKLPFNADSWKKSYMLAILLFGVGVVGMWNQKDFSLAPVFTDMIGTATFDNVRVSKRVAFFSNAVILFFIAGVVALVTQSAVKIIFRENVIARQINRFAAISALFFLQQVLINEISYFFILFFGIATCVYIVILKFKQGYSNAELLAILVALISSALLSISTLPMELLCSFELSLLLLYKHFNRKCKLTERALELKKEALFFVITASVVFILFFLLLLFRVDFFDIVQHIQWKKEIPVAIILICLFPLLAVFPVYFLLKRKYYSSDLYVIRWFCFVLFFIVAQFADNYLPVLLMMLVFLLKAFVLKSRKTLEYYLLAVDVLLSLSVFYLINLFGIVIINEYSKFIVPFLFLIIAFIREVAFSKVVNTGKYKYVVPVVLTPLLLFFIQELYMLFNQHNIFLGKLGFWVLLLFAYGLLFIITFFWKPNSLKPVFSVTFAFAIAGIGIYNSYTPVWLGDINFFEDASSAVAIKRMVSNGELPVFEHFSPHNLNDFITGIFYALLNNDLSFGYKIYNCIYGLFFLVYYFLLSSLFKSKLLGFIWTMFSGVLWIMLPMYHAISVLAFMNLYWYFKSEYKFLRVIITSFVLLATFFFRVDTGVAVLASVIVSTPFFVMHYKRGMKKLKLLIITSTIILFVLAVVALLKIGYKQSMDSVQMILGYLDSAQSWGYSVLSRVYNFKFRIHYFIFPVAVITGLLYVLLLFREKFKSLVFLQLCLVFFSVYYLVNFQRGLIRHSFFENRDVNLSSYIYFLIGLFVALVFVKGGRQLKLISLFLVTVSCNIWLFKFPRTFENRSLYSASIDKIRTTTELSFACQKIKRFDLEKLSQIKEGAYELFVYSRIDQLGNVYKTREKANLDFMGVKLHSYSRYFLEPYGMNESFFPDLSKLVQAGVISEPVDEVCYQPMLNYFVNSKPAHLFNQGMHFYHTKKMQEQFIGELVESECKYVLVNNVSADTLADYLDDVPHSIRHYHILQHIYRNYKPAAIVDKKTLWVKDSTLLRTQPLLQYKSLMADSFYKFPDPVDVNGKKLLLTFIGKEIINEGNIIINDRFAFPISFTNRNDKKSFVLIEGGIDEIRDVLLPGKADSLMVSLHNYFPDVYTNVPLTYKLKQLPYVLAQSGVFNNIGEELALDVKQPQAIESLLKANEDLRGAALCFTFSNYTKEDRMVIVQYYRANEFLGEFHFLAKPGKHIPYLLQVASQPNWNLAKPGKIKIIMPENLQVDALHLITKDELSY
ncbi:hypothetical protein [Lacibacter luteus]|uniref:hypothetical protein n=1 Tax=Lacibacter luteus TaxID=2508719 RepID=UPI0013E946DB|nr:hypothetical protein [Lacibacter luteus]